METTTTRKNAETENNENDKLMNVVVVVQSEHDHKSIGSRTRALPKGYLNYFPDFLKLKDF